MKMYVGRDRFGKQYVVPILQKALFSSDHFQGEILRDATEAEVRAMGMSKQIRRLDVLKVEPVQEDSQRMKDAGLDLIEAVE